MTPTPHIHHRADARDHAPHERGAYADGIVDALVAGRSADHDALRTSLDEAEPGPFRTL